MPQRTGLRRTHGLMTVCAMWCICGMVSVIHAATPVRQPAVVAYLSSIDGVLDDMEYVLESGNQPELFQMVKGFLTNLNDLKGIDRTLPIGVMAYVPLNLEQVTREPEVIGFLPFNNVEELRKTFHLSNLISLEPTAQPDRFELKTTEKTLYVKLDQGYAFLADKSSLLDAALVVPSTLTEVLGSQYDVVVQLRREGVPKLIWDLALVGMLTASDKELKTLRQNSSSEDALKVRGIELGRAAVVSIMTDVQSVWLGLRVSRQDHNAVLDAKLEFNPSGKVMQAMHTMVDSSSRLAHLTESDAPASLQLQLVLPEQVRRLTGDIGKAVVQKEDPVASTPEPHRDAVRSLIEVMQKTVDEGRYDLLVQLTGQAQTGMTLVVGIQVSDGQSLSSAMKALLPEIRHSDDVKEVVLDAGEARGIRFSRIEGKDDEPSDEEENRDSVDLFYGGKPSLYVGMEEKIVWLIVGDGDALDDFSSLAVETEANRTPSDDHLSHFSSACIHLSDWLGLLSMDRDPKAQEFTAAARAAVKDPDRDAVRLSIYPATDGLQMTLTFDEAYLNLLGAVVGKD